MNDPPVLGSHNPSSHSVLRMAHTSHFTFLPLILSCIWDSYIYKVKFDFLLLICLMPFYLTSPKEPKMGSGAGNFPLPSRRLGNLICSSAPVLGLGVG